MGILDSLPWDKILELLTKFMSTCPKDEARVVDEVRAPSRVSKWRFERAARRDGLELSPEQFEALYHRAATASQLELQQLVRESWGMF